jgi:hypothetical protein
MIVQGPERVAYKLNNAVLLCLKTNTLTCIIVCQFYNATGCPLQQKSFRYLQNNKTESNFKSTRHKQLFPLNYVTSSSNLSAQNIMTALFQLPSSRMEISL